MIRKNRYKNKSLITVISILISILLLICLNTIAYSAFYSTVLITGDAYARVEKNIRITDISLTSVEGDGFEIYSPSYSSNTILTGVQLNSLNSSVKYQVEVVNFGNVDMAITNIVKQSDSNTNITFDVNYESNVISAGSTLTIDIIYRYDSSITTLPSNKLLETVLFFEFSDLSNPKIVEGNTWYKGSTGKTKIKTISIVEQYTPPTDGTLLESWDASVDENSSVMVYILSNYNLIITGNGSKILANENCSYMFDGFTYVTNITGLINLDTSKVTDMSYMFRNIGAKVSSFSTDVSSFNTENVTTFKGMFYRGGGTTATSWTIGSLSNWKTGNATTFAYMFYETAQNAEEFDIGDLGNWDMSKVTTLAYMFYSTAPNVDEFILSGVGNWNTSSVTNMSNLFAYSGENSSSWDVGDLSGWNTAKVTNMSSMFCVACYSASYQCDLGDLSGWNTARVTNMDSMFFYAGLDYGIKPFNMGNWNVSKVKNMSDMLMGFGSVDELGLKNWNVSNVTNMSRLFAQADLGGTFDISTWNVSKVTDMSGLFHQSYNLYVLDISGWNTSLVTNMTEMFNGCNYLRTIYVGSGWNTAAVTSSTNMFYNNVTLPNFNSSVVDKTNAHSNSGGYLTFKS